MHAAQGIERRSWKFRVFREDLSAHAATPELQRIARYLIGADRNLSDAELSMHPRDVRLGQTARLLDGVQRRVRFVETPIYTPPLMTWARGAGDCKSSATLLAALAEGVGCPSRLVAMGHDPSDPSHVCCQLKPLGAWLWAETTIPGAMLGEHPVDAALRLEPNARADLGMGAPVRRRSLEQGFGAPHAVASPHAAARAVVVQAFQRVAGRAPSRFEAQLVQGVALQESGYGTAWQGACAGSHNWGAVQSRDGSGCDYTDSYPDGTRYAQKFVVYADDVSGAAAVVSLMTKSMPLVAGELRAGRGVWNVCQAMFYSHYFGAACPNALARYGAAAKQSLAFGTGKATTAAGKACEAECIGEYATALAGRVNTIADALGEPRPPFKGSALGPVLFVAGGAALLYAAHRYARLF